jgi:hypothetical protein
MGSAASGWQDSGEPAVDTGGGQVGRWPRGGEVVKTLRKVEVSAHSPSVHFLTTFGCDSHLERARALATSIRRFGEPDDRLIYYAEHPVLENFEHTEWHPEAAVPHLRAFREAHGDSSIANGILLKHISHLKQDLYFYKLDALRFSYKALVISEHLLSAAPRDDCWWIDVDISFHAPFHPVLERIQEDCDQRIGFFDRIGFGERSCESGLLYFPASGDASIAFAERMQDFYGSGSIFGQQEWHDGHLVSRILRGSDLGANLNLDDSTDPINQVLGSVLSHAKGLDEKYVDTRKEQLSEAVADGRFARRWARTLPGRDLLILLIKRLLGR